MTDRKICPREPTTSMIEAAIGSAPITSASIWRAMYDAAPSAPSDDALVARLRRVAVRQRDMRPLVSDGAEIDAAADRIAALTAELAQAHDEIGSLSLHVEQLQHQLRGTGQEEWGDTLRDKDAAIRAATARAEAAEANVDALIEQRDAEIARAERADAYERALRSIASCEPHHPDDVVSIARAALASQGKEPAP